jgi:hypothetical protein
MASAVTTWGTCRTAIGNGSSGLASTGANNLEWTSGFYTTEGNGFLRVDPQALTSFYNTYVEYVSGTTFDLNSATLAIVLDQRDADALIGQNATVTGPITFAITSDYLTAGGQIVGSGSAPIVSIDTLTAF